MILFGIRPSNCPASQYRLLPELFRIILRLDSTREQHITLRFVPQMKPEMSLLYQMSFLLLLRPFRQAGVEADIPQTQRPPQSRQIFKRFRQKTKFYYAGKIHKMRILYALSL